MAGRGGARPGAGRKPTALKRIIHATPIQQAEGKIRDRLPWLVDQMMVLAEGVVIQKADKLGRPMIYEAPPDRAAIEYLMDRIMGKPKQPVDVTLRQEAERLATDFGLPLEEVQEEVERILAART